MANKRLVSSEILNVELINKFLLKKATLSLNNSLKTEVTLNLESGSNLSSKLKSDQKISEESDQKSTSKKANSNPNSNPKSDLNSSNLSSKTDQKSTSKKVNSNLDSNPNSTQKQKLFIPLDGSEIRKQRTTKSEKLDRVRSLDVTIINGYHSYSTISVTENSHNIQILEIKPFSTKEEDFLSKNKVVLAY